MLEHARNLEFEQAARARDEVRLLKEKLFGVAEGELPKAQDEAGGRA
jgi:protein-arginine kinase activator protein McsA